jgi:hypothetical protein
LEERFAQMEHFEVECERLKSELAKATKGLMIEE